MQSRFYSLILALQIKAREVGIAEVPAARRRAAAAGEEIIILRGKIPVARLMIRQLQKALPRVPELPYC